MTTHHVEHHVSLRNFRAFGSFILLSVPSPLSLIEDNDTLRGGGAAFMVMIISESMNAVNEGLHEYLRCATSNRFPQ